MTQEKNLFIDSTSFRPVRSFNRRVRFLILHYTAQNFVDSVHSLTQGSVSAHYLLPDPNEESYLQAGFQGMRIFNLVDEQERAWHAGVSHWEEYSHLNDTSIGIEIVNLASDIDGTLTFPPYPTEQITAVKWLAAGILQRYPDITPTHVLAHSDIAPDRKSDPGAAFPWFELYQAGIGAWYDEQTTEKYQRQFSQRGLPADNEILQQLQGYGYPITLAATAEGFSQLIQAFQLHFRPSCYDGVVDITTAAILYALVEKYCG